jgi:hypothetical protein
MFTNPEGLKPALFSKPSEAVRFFAPTLITALILGLGMQALCQTSADTRAARPSFTINAYLLENVAMVPNENVLEIAVTNTSDKDLSFWNNDAWPIWGLFGIDFRDAEGKPVPLTPAGRDLIRTPNITTYVGHIEIRRGKTLLVDVLLNRRFELNQPGQYEIKVHLRDPESRVTVESNPVRITIPSPRTSHRAKKPPFSITLATPFQSVEQGWQIPVHITMKNTSRTDLRWAVWEGAVPDEFDSGLQVLDRNGNPVPRTRKGLDDQQIWEMGTGGFNTVRIPPGKSADVIRPIGRLFNVSKPGKCAIQEVLADPSGNLVKSNPVSVEVAPPLPEKQASTRIKPPFMVTITLDPSLSSNAITYFRICQTNVSNHDIRLDNFTFNDEIRLTDAEGKSVDPPQISKADKMASDYYEIFSRERSQRDNKPEFHFISFPPGNTVCGEIGLARSLRPREMYSVQIVRHDYPDRPPDKKIDEMPVVESNTLMFEVQK